MTARRQFVTLTRGDSRTLRIPVLDKDGVPFDLTGWAIRWGLFWRGKVVLEKNSGEGGGIAIDEQEGHVFEVTLKPEDTASLPARLYAHEAEISKGELVYTVTDGLFSLTRDALRPEEEEG